VAANGQDVHGCLQLVHKLVHIRFDYPVTVYGHGRNTKPAPPAIPGSTIDVSRVSRCGHGASAHFRAVRSADGRRRGAGGTKPDVTSDSGGPLNLPRPAPQLSRPPLTPPRRAVVTPQRVLRRASPGQRADTGPVLPAHRRQGCGPHHRRSGPAGLAAAVFHGRRCPARLHEKGGLSQGGRNGFSPVYTRSYRDPLLSTCPRNSR
jgi:hypothetical protein